MESMKPAILGALTGLLLPVAAFFGYEWWTAIPEAPEEETFTGMGLVSSTAPSKFIVNGREYRYMKCSTRGNDIICNIRR